MAAIFRFSSLAGLTAAVLAPLLAYLLHAGTPVVVMAIGMGVLILIRHHENIGRLVRGQEPRIGDRGAKEAAMMGHNGGPAI